MRFAMRWVLAGSCLRPAREAVSLNASLDFRQPVLRMNTDEIYQRFRIGFALVVGYVCGKGLALIMGHHASEFFVVGFGAGVILCHAVYWLLQRRAEKRRP